MVEIKTVETEEQVFETETEKMQVSPPTISGRRKAAILLVSLGAEHAADVMRLLTEDQVEVLTWEIGNLGDVSGEETATVLEEFQGTRESGYQATRGGMDFVKLLLEKSFGEERSDTLMNRLSMLMKPEPFEALRNVNVSHVLDFLRNEHPQTISLVLSRLSPQQAGTILSELPDELQQDVAYRIATSDPPSPTVVEEIEQLIAQRLSPLSAETASVAVPVDGVNALVQILNGSARATEKSVLAGLDHRDTELAEHVRQKMFLFEDIVQMDDRSIQRMLQEVDIKDLGLALKGSSDDLRERIFKNMSERAGTILDEDMQVMGPVRVRDVEAIQQQVVDTLRELEDAGELVLGREGKEETVE